jgi:flagellar hook assembly protein FlgD
MGLSYCAHEEPRKGAAMSRPSRYSRVHRRAGSRVRRRAGALTFGVVAMMLVLSWVVPHLSARTAAWLSTTLVFEKTIKVADVVTVGGLGAPGTAARLGQRPLSQAPTVATVDAGTTFDMVGVLLRVPGGRSPASLHVDVRTSLDGKAWSGWWTLALDAAGPKGSTESPSDSLSDPAWVGASRYLQYRVSAMTERGFPAAPGLVRDLRFSFLNAEGSQTMADRLLSGVKATIAAIASLPRVATATAMTQTPTIVTRGLWGADESWRAGTPSYATVKMAFVHHTDGSNSYSPAQSAAIVRGIYYYHTHVRGWSDIGYDFLIDRYGTVFEGRYGGVTQGVVGAHVYGFNTGSTGVAVMGSFVTVPPPPAAIASLERLLAWKLDLHHVDPSGTALMTTGATEKFVAGQKVTFPTIAGHRQANYTSCPGDAFFAMLPTIRRAVAGIGLPKIYDIGLTTTAISPNGDGQQDGVKVTFRNSEAAAWKIELRRPDGTIARTFLGQGTSASATWDGRDEGGQVVPDGSYGLTASASSAAGVARPATATVLVDTKAPTFVSSSARSATFSPNGDGIAELASVDFATSEPVDARLQVRDANHAVTRVYGWVSLPAGKQALSWDGKRVLGGALAAASDGRYTLEVGLRDRADNLAAVSHVVTLNRTLGFPAARPAWFSPNADRAADATTLSFRLSVPARVTVRLSGASGTVRTLGLGRLAAGTRAVTWRGQDQAGNLVPDGTYRAVVTASNDLGVVSVATKVIKDTKRPVLSAQRLVSVARSASAKIGYLARDGGNSVVAVEAVVRRTSGAVVRRFSSGWVSAGHTHAFAFTPVGAGKYLVTFRARDRAGNWSWSVVTTVVAK